MQDPYLLYTTYNDTGCCILQEIIFYNSQCLRFLHSTADNPKLHENTTLKVLKTCPLHVINEFCSEIKKTLLDYDLCISINPVLKIIDFASCL